MTHHQGKREDEDSFDVSCSDLARRVTHEERPLGDLLSHEQHAEFVRSLDDDPDLATT